MSVRVKGHALWMYRHGAYDIQFVCECGETGPPAPSFFDAREEHRRHKMFMKNALTTPPLAEYHEAMNTIIYFSGDWAAVVDAEGNMVDQGHHDDVRERELDRLGIITIWPVESFDEVADYVGWGELNGKRRSWFAATANFKAFL